MISIIPTALRLLLMWLLLNDPPQRPQDPPRMSFQLRHQHPVSNSSWVIFNNIRESELLAHSLTSPADPYVYTVNTARITTYKPSSMAAFHEAHLRSMRHAQNDATLWDGVDITGPDVTSREMLLTLAKMTNNAYLAGPEDGWYDVDGFNNVSGRQHERQFQFTNQVAVVHPRWLGTLCRWSSGPHLHLRRQQHCHSLYQGYLGWLDNWQRRSDRIQGQTERKYFVFMLLCTRRSDMEPHL